MSCMPNRLINVIFPLTCIFSAVFLMPKDKSSYCGTFAKLLADRVKLMTNCRNFDIIVSIPLHKSREIERGYNQAYLISRILSKTAGIREASEVLSRVDNTHTYYGFYGRCVQPGFEESRSKNSFGGGYSFRKEVLISIKKE